MKRDLEDELYSTHNQKDDLETFHHVHCILSLIPQLDANPALLYYSPFLLTLSLFVQVVAFPV